MKAYQFKLVLLIFLFGLIAYFNYPSFKSFFSQDNSSHLQELTEKQALANKLLADFSNLALALPDLNANRIELLINSDFKGELESANLEFVLDHKFKLVKDDEKYFFNQVDFGEDVFISDYVKRLNQLIQNTKKIKNVELEQDSLVFYLEPDSRLALSSLPISLILEEEKFDWFYDLVTSSYKAKQADSPYLLNLGLDLKGGTYLDVGLNETKTDQRLLERYKKSLEDELEDQSLTPSVSIQDKSLVFNSKTAPDFDSPTFVNLLESFELDENQAEYKLTPSPELLSQNRSESLDQAIRIIRDRIDLLGVKDPTIQKRGSDSIVVQVPGQTDSANIKGLITKPANLEFRLLADEANSETISLDFEEQDPITKEVISREPITLENKVLIEGNVISDARVVFDEFTGAPQISFSLNPDEALEFGRITQENQGRFMAIILDQKVRSYPRINQAIYGGSGSISGQFSLEEARELAIVLRSGALPASLTIQEERIVGASLGETSVKASLYSFIVGFLLLSLFMAVYYRLSGLIAIIALLGNLFLILAILAFFGATLTLPGIAGIILTIAMAVDANVLIYERIREELHQDSSPVQAVEQSFKRVAITILDSNITTLLVAATLFQFGTGPIRGFALTLAIGIFSTIFTSLVVSHWIFEVVYFRKKHRSEPISI